MIGLHEMITSNDWTDVVQQNIVIFQWQADYLVADT